MGEIELTQYTLRTNAGKTLKHLEMVIILSQSESKRLVIFETKSIIYNFMNKKRLETKQARRKR